MYGRHAGLAAADESLQSAEAYHAFRPELVVDRISPHGGPFHWLVWTAKRAAHRRRRVAVRSRPMRWIISNSGGLTLRPETETLTAWRAARVGSPSPSTSRR